MEILTTDEIGTTKVTSVFNIDMLVGNGFDIRLLKHLHSKATTRYSDFFDWEKGRKTGGPSKSNVILQLMAEAKDKQDPDWSDLELAIKNNIKKTVDSAKNIPIKEEREKVIDDVVTETVQSVEEIQSEFSTFLLQVVSPQLFSKTNSLANKRIKDEEFYPVLYRDDASAPGINSMRGFAIDVNKSKANGNLKFAMDDITHDFDVFNWNVFNLNYTYLLDNFLNFDVDIFEPHKRKQAKTNFVFYPKTHQFRGHKRSYSDYLRLSLFHPHGQMSIPSSMLFGVDTIDDFYGSSVPDNARYTNTHHMEQRLSKRYLAQDDLKYRYLLNNGVVFIAFGTSFGESDQWWWNQIFTGMSEDIDLKNLMPKLPTDIDPSEASQHRDNVKSSIFKRELVCYEYAENQVDPMTNVKVAEECRKYVLNRLQKLYYRAKNDSRCDTSSWKDFDDLVNQIFVVPYNESSTLATFELPPVDHK